MSPVAPSCIVAQAPNGCCLPWPVCYSFSKQSISLTCKTVVNIIISLALMAAAERISISKLTFLVVASAVVDCPCSLFTGGELRRYFA